MWTWKRKLFQCEEFPKKVLSYLSAKARKLGDKEDIYDNLLGGKIHGIFEYDTSHRTSLLSKVYNLEAVYLSLSSDLEILLGDVDE